MDEQLPQISNSGFGTELWDEQKVLGRRLQRAEPKSIKLDREGQAKNIVEVFELIGGVPRLAAWAHEFPYQFYTKLLPKILPQQSELNISGSLNVVYHAAIPPSPLDGEYEILDSKDSVCQIPLIESSHSTMPMEQPSQQSSLDSGLQHPSI